ncbi:hypothetical protein D3C75_907640 [compost metagenome]
MIFAAACAERWLVIAADCSGLLGLLCSCLPIELVGSSTVGLTRQIGTQSGTISAGATYRADILLDLLGISLVRRLVGHCFKLHLLADSVVFGHHCWRRFAGFLSAAVAEID